MRLKLIAGLDINSTDKSLLDNLEKRGHVITSTDAILAWPVMILMDRKSGMSYGAGQPGKKVGEGKTCAAINLGK